jgi:PAS domain S-box-containing protein
VFGSKGELFALNKRAREILGRTADEATLLKLGDLVAPEKRAGVPEMLSVLKKKGKALFVTQMAGGGAKLLDWELSATSVGRNTYVALCRDISARVRAEARSARQENEYHAFLQSLPYPSAIFINRKLAIKNGSFDLLFPWVREGVSLSEFLGKKNAATLKEIAAVLDHPESAARVERRELIVAGPDKTRVPTEVSIVPVQVQGKPALYCAFVDVAERRRILDQAEATEEKFRALLETSLDALALSHDGKFVLVNRKFAEMFGYASPMEVLGKSITSVVAGRDAARMILEQERKRADGEEIPADYEYTGKKHDGTRITVAAQAARVTVGGTPAILSYHRDITGVKALEETIHRKLDGLERLHRIAKELTEARSLDDVYTRGLHAALKHTQFESGAALVIDRLRARVSLHAHRSCSEKMLATLAAQNLDDGFVRFFEKTHEPLVSAVAEYPAFLHHKSLFETEQYKAVAFLPIVVKEQLNGIILLATKKERLPDEDDKKILGSFMQQLASAVEKILLADTAAQADERFLTTMKNIADVVYTLRSDGTFEYISASVERLIDHKPTDFLTNAGLWRTLVHPDDRPLLSSRVSNQALPANEFVLEYRMLPKGKATYIWVRDAVRYLRDAQGNTVAITGILSDNTPSKKLAELKGDTASALQISPVVQSVADGLALFDNELICREWNAAFESLTGVERSAMLGKNINDLPLLRDPLCELVGGVRATENRITKEVSFLPSHGEEPVTLAVSASAWKSALGEHLGVVVAATDVSTVRSLENEVLETADLLRSIMDQMSEALVIASPEGEVLGVNDAFMRMTGFTREDVRLATFPYPWLEQEEMAQLAEWIAARGRRSPLVNAEMNWRRNDGQQIPVSVNATTLHNAEGEPIVVLTVARETTERNALAAELEWKRKQFDLLNNIISFANTTTDLDSIFAVIAREVNLLVPYDGMSIMFLDEAQQLTPWYLSVLGPTGESQRVDNLAVDATVIYDAVRTSNAVITSRVQGSETQWQITIPLSVSDKVLGAFSLISLRPNAFTGDELSFLQPVADQIGAIIQRIRLFHQVSEDSSYIHNLLDSINNVVYTVDAGYRITQVNKAWCEFATRIGMQQWADAKAIVGQSLRVIVPDDDLWDHYRRVMDDLFARRIEYYSREFEIGSGATQGAYHLIINPMILNNKVTALVFTYTDITEVNRSEAEIKRRNRELVALNAIATSINKSLELESILRVAAEQLREAFDATIVAFFLVDEEHRRLVLSRSLGIPEEIAATISTLDIAHSLAGKVVATRKPVYIMSGDQGENSLTEMGRRMVRLLDIRSSGTIPMQSKDKVQGAFMIGYSEKHVFSEKDQQLLLVIGNQLGAVLENATLYEEVQRQVKTLTTLYELGKGLTGVLDLRSMLRVVYGEIRKALPLDRFYYQAFVPEWNALTLVSKVADGEFEFYPSGVKMRTLQDWPLTVYQQILAEGKPFVGSTDPAATDSLMAVPIKSEDKTVGIISIVANAPQRYNAADLRLFESIATLTGVAIGKAILYEDTLKKSSELENRNKELDDFTYVVSHDLKEPLISIEGYSKIVMKDYKDKLDEEGREYLGSVVQSTTRMKNLIEDLLTLSRLGRMQDAYESVSVKDIVDDILHDLQFSLREKNVTARVADNLPTVRFSATRLSMVFRNLISNAMKFNNKPNPVVEIGVRDGEEEHVFFVADNGIGIEPQYFERIFTIFQRLKRSEEYRGTGAGLTIAKKIVEREGGRIWVESKPGEGSTFYFTVKKTG